MRFRLAPISLQREQSAGRRVDGDQGLVGFVWEADRVYRCSLSQALLFAMGSGRELDLFLDGRQETTVIEALPILAICQALAVS